MPARPKGRPPPAAVSFAGVLVAGLSRAPLDYGAGMVQTNEPGDA